MPRVKRGNVHKNRRRRILKQAKGYYGSDSRLYASARDAVDRAMQYAYTGRKLRKRDFRRLWITRINAACRQNEISYSRFMAGLKAAGVGLDRKVLAEIAVEDPETFAQLTTAAKDSLAA
jgi:large subunit ribosomal protein L20